LSEAVPTFEEMKNAAKMLLQYMDKGREIFSVDGKQEHIHDLNRSMNHLGFCITSLELFIENTK